MCDSNHLPRSKPTDSQMPPDNNALISPKPCEHFISCASNHIRPNHTNPEGPDLDMAHSITTPNSPPDQSKSTSGLQPRHSTSSQPSFEEVAHDNPNWRDNFLKDTKVEVNLLISESMRNSEHLPPGNDAENAPNGRSMEKLEPRLPTSSTGEARLQLSSSMNISRSISDGIGKEMLEERSSYTKECEGSQKNATCMIVNERTTFVESYGDTVAYGDKQNFSAYRSETKAGCAEGNEAETRFDVSVETKPRGSETRSRLEPCAETKPDLDETCETLTEFGDLNKPETGFGDSVETETGFGVTGKTETGFGDTGEAETGFGNLKKPETGFGDTKETETGFGDTKETETAFDQRNSKQDRRSASSSSSTSSSADWKKFDATAIGTVTHELLQRTLDTVTYDPHRCRVLSHDLAGQILATIIGLVPKRYKLVTFVSVGSLKDDPGVQFGSRCLWDADTDGLATVRYANETLFAVVMVYGLYRE